MMDILLLLVGGGGGGGGSIFRAHIPLCLVLFSKSLLRSSNSDGSSGR